MKQVNAQVNLVYDFAFMFVNQAIFASSCAKELHVFKTWVTAIVLAFYI